VTTSPSRGRRKKYHTEEDVGDVAYVCGLEVEEVEEGGVVHGGRGPRRRCCVVFIGAFFLY
jgi:hypothetical protein